MTITDQLVLTFGDEADPNDLSETGIKHICFPDFSLACGLGFLEKPRGDRVHFGRPKRWREVTCRWCRALGRDYCGHIYTMFRERG